MVRIKCRRSKPLARALCRNPQALLLDEPTASLDAASSDLVEAMLKSRLGAGLPMILITHDATQARRLARKTLTLVGGRFENAPA